MSQHRRQQDDERNALAIASLSNVALAAAGSKQRFSPADFLPRAAPTPAPAPKQPRPRGPDGKLALTATEQVLLAMAGTAKPRKKKPKRAGSPPSPLEAWHEKFKAQNAAKAATT